MCVSLLSTFVFERRAPKRRKTPSPLVPFKGVAEEAVGQGLFQNRGADVAWFVNKFNLDLSPGGQRCRRVVDDPFQYGVTSFRTSWRALRPTDRHREARLRRIWSH